MNGGSSSSLKSLSPGRRMAKILTTGINNKEKTISHELSEYLSNGYFDFDAIEEMSRKYPDFGCYFEKTDMIRIGDYENPGGNQKRGHIDKSVMRTPPVYTGEWI